MTEEEGRTERKQHVQKPRDERERWPFGETRVIRGDWNRLQRIEGKEVKMMNISKCLGDRHVREWLALLRAAR